VGTCSPGGTRNGMPASLILRFARTRRFAIVSSGTRNARAISPPVSPASVRRVSATCASRPSAGWQQVKISSSRSSRMTVSSLGRALAGLMPNEPEIDGLLALMLLTNARRDARVADGTIVLLRTRTGRYGTPARSPRAERCSNGPWRSAAGARTWCRRRSPRCTSTIPRTGPGSRTSAASSPPSRARRRAALPRAAVGGTRERDADRGVCGQSPTAQSL
jgi:hypothetical protein